jgi:uncharacterized membrane protein
MGMLILVVCGLPARGGLTFQGLGAMFAGDSSAVAVSADGSIVVGQGSLANGTTFAYRWTAAGGVENIGDFTPIGISADGSIVVGTRSFMDGDTFRSEAYRWTAATGAKAISEMNASAEAISADGSTIVGRVYTPAYEAFRWTAEEGIVGLGRLSGGLSVSGAYGVSADGSVIVGFSSSALTPHGIEPMRWTRDGGMVGLGFVSSGLGMGAAYDVSADGSIVVGGEEVAAGDVAFRWTAAGGHEILTPGPDSTSKALVISGDGSTIPGASMSGSWIYNSSYGFRSLDAVLTAGGLSVDGWQFDAPLDASFDGTTLVGTGVHDGKFQAWIISGVPVPEVSEWSLGLVGFLTVVVIGRGCRRGEAL